MTTKITHITPQCETDKPDCTTNINHMTNKSIFNTRAIAVLSNPSRTAGAVVSCDSVRKSEMAEISQTTAPVLQ